MEGQRLISLSFFVYLFGSINNFPYISIVMNNTLITYLRNYAEAFSGQSHLVFGVECKDVLDVAESSSETLKWTLEKYMTTMVALKKLKRLLKSFLH